MLATINHSMSRIPRVLRPRLRRGGQLRGGGAVARVAAAAAPAAHRAAGADLHGNLLGGGGQLQPGHRRGQHLPHAEVLLAAGPAEPGQGDAAPLPHPGRPEQREGCR